MTMVTASSTCGRSKVCRKRASTAAKLQIQVTFHRTTVDCSSKVNTEVLPIMTARPKPITNCKKKVQMSTLQQMGHLNNYILTLNMFGWSPEGLPVGEWETGLRYMVLKSTWMTTLTYSLTTSSKSHWYHLLKLLPPTKHWFSLASHQQLFNRGRKFSLCHAVHKWVVQQ